MSNLLSTFCFYRSNTHVPQVHAERDALISELLEQMRQQLETSLPDDAAGQIGRHYTPKHGSWLDMAEIELGVLSRQSLDRHLPDVDMLKSEALAWEQTRNNAKRTVNWHFTTQDARTKLKKLYPTILP